MKPNLPPPYDYTAWTAAIVLVVAGALVVLSALWTIFYPSSIAERGPPIEIAGNGVLDSFHGVGQSARSLSPRADAASAADASVPDASEVFVGVEEPIEEQPPTY